MTEKTYTQSSWSLKELFDSFEDPKIEETYQALTTNVEQFESYRDQLSPDISTERFLEIVRNWEKSQKLGYRLYGFAELSFAANFIQSRNFRAFETYALTTLLYLCMALLIRQLLNWIGRRYISRSSQ